MRVLLFGALLRNLNCETMSTARGRGRAQRGTSNVCQYTYFLALLNSP